MKSLLFGYAFNDEPISVFDLTVPGNIKQLLADLTDPDIIKTAYNANFERTCLAKYFSLTLPPEQWRCTQVHAMTLGLPLGLANVAKALNLQQQKRCHG